MKILIDGEEITFPEKAQTYTDLLSQVSGYCREQQRIITGLSADNQRVTSIKDLPNGVQYEDVKLFEVSTGPTRDVAIGVLRGCAEHLAQLSDAFAETAAQLKTGDTREAMAMLVSAVNLWMDLVSGTDSALQVLGLDWNSVLVHPVSVDGEEPVPAEKIVSELNEILEEIQRVIEQEDTVELIDILEYDLPPLLKGYQEALFSLADVAAKPMN